MKLSEAVEKLDGLNDDAVLCVKRPWSPDATCCVTEMDESLAVPAEVRAEGFEYFLEVHVANEVLGVLDRCSPSLEDKLRLLTFYAEHDAYPDWVYQS